jgi:hypothetical protein
MSAAQLHGGPPDAGSASAVEKFEACFLGSQGPLLPLHPQRQGTILNIRRLVNKKNLIVGTDTPLAKRKIYKTSSLQIQNLVR